jgi:hypothetical protein
VCVIESLKVAFIAGSVEGLEKLVKEFRGERLEKVYRQNLETLCVQKSIGIAWRPDIYNDDDKVNFVMSLKIVAALRDLSN